MPAIVGTTPLSDEHLEWMENEITAQIYKGYHEGSDVMPLYDYQLTLGKLLALVKEARAAREEKATLNVTVKSLGDDLLFEEGKL